MRSYPHSDANPFSGSHIYSFPHLHGRADSLGHSVAHYDSDAYSYCHADGDDNTDGNSDAYSYCNADDDDNTNGDCDAYSYYNADDDGHTNGYHGANTYTNVNVYTLQRQGYDLPQARLEKS